MSDANSSIQFENIKAALLKYAALTESEQEIVSEEYNALCEAIASYNSKAEKLNEEHTNTAQMMISVASTASLLAALAWVASKGKIV